VVGDAVYFVNKAGVAFCNDLTTGALRWSLRLPDSCWASPLASGENIYFFSKNGVTTVLRNSPEKPEKVAESKLTVTGRVYGVAAVDGALLVRTGDRLLCLAQPSA
jgi:outer membrane protein assembly factor BamB